MWDGRVSEMGLVNLADLFKLCELNPLASSMFLRFMLYFTQKKKLMLPSALHQNQSPTCLLIDKKRNETSLEETEQERERESKVIET